MRTLGIGLAAVIAAIVLGGSADCQIATDLSPEVTTNTSAGPSGRMAPLDEKFFVDAAMSNNAVIELGRLALERSTDPRIKGFAELVIKRSINANAELAGAAEKIGVRPSADISLNDRFVLDGLRELRGADFDLTYIRQQLGTHAMLLDLYRRAEKKTRDRQLKAFAKERRPILEQQYQSLLVLDDQTSPAMSMVIKVPQ